MSHRSIMVVDDDAALLSAVTGLMEMHLPDVRVQPFDSPRRALAQFEQHEVFALLTDLHMRELDGLALLRGAQALRPHVPVILFSSQVDARLAAQAIAMGAHDVLRKPFNREEFITALTLALNTYTLAREVRTRRLMTGRLSKRVADIKRLIAEGQGRPNTIRRIQEQVSASRQLNIKSVATLESSLERLWQSARMAQARLEEAQQRLLIRQQENIEACLKRNRD